MSTRKGNASGVPRPLVPFVPAPPTSPRRSRSTPPSRSGDYPRYTPLDAFGAPDPVRGIRQFVVRTGGVNFTTLADTPAAYGQSGQRHYLWHPTPDLASHQLRLAVQSWGRPELHRCQHWVLPRRDRGLRELG